MQEYFQHLAKDFKIPLEKDLLIFSLVLFIILLSPVLLRRINIPSIVGLIISGVVIGPKGLGILGEKSGIELFSTLGLLYIMFIAGLELDMNDFKINRNKSLLFGLFTFIFPMAIGFPVCHYVLGYDPIASLLTASMFSTHTLVAYPIVSRLGISRNEAVSVAVGGTILTDTAVLIMLPVIMGSKAGSINGAFWLRLTISFILFLFIMFFIIPRVAKWFFRKLESEKHSHYIFVLAVLFFAAFLAEAAGVEKIIGAFVAGLALNRLIPQSSPLMNRIEFTGNALFIPFFLISVGMVVDVRVLLSGPTAVIVAVVLTIVALFGKWFAAFVTQLVFKYTRYQRQLIFGLSSSHAAATLAIIFLGFKANILDENILNGTIILILITCLVASFVTERSAKKILMHSDGQEIGTAERSTLTGEHILLPIANFENMDKMLELAILLKDRKSSNPVSLLSVVPNNEEAELNILLARKTLEKIAVQASATETMVNIVTTIDHNASSGIARISREIMADIILLGWPQRSAVIDRLMGEKTTGILESTDKTMFICHLSKPLVAHKRIIVPCPPLAEKENGFTTWLAKVIKLQQELSIPLHFYCNDKTKVAIQKWLAKLASACTFIPFEDWDDFLVLTREVGSKDLFILVSARMGSASYFSGLDVLPGKLEKHLHANSRIIIYPQQYLPEYINEQNHTQHHGPVSKGVERIQNLGKGLADIFRGGDDAG
jgi:Kef-type K+ transport system membrane component KefB